MVSRYEFGEAVCVNQGQISDGSKGSLLSSSLQLQYYIKLIDLMSTNKTTTTFFDL